MDADNDLVSPQGTSGNRKRNRDLNEATAIGLLAKFPDWTVEQIANELGVARTTPYDWDRFKHALAARKQAKLERRRGHKYDGRIESIDDEGADLAEQDGHRRPQHRSLYDD